MTTIQEIKDKNLLLLECISGSRAYGLDTTRSDTDIKGVFYMPRDQLYGLEYVPQVSNVSNDEVYYEIGRFVELLIRNNPNMLELLATPEDMVLYRHPLIDRLPVDLFLSKLCKETFAGYAHTQIRKARGYKKKVVNPIEPDRKNVTDFCFIPDGSGSISLQQWLYSHDYRQEHCGLTAIAHTKGLYALFHDPEGKLGYKGIVSGDEANAVSLSSIPKGMQPVAHLYFNIESYSAYCREYSEYWEWVAKRNETRYLGNMAHGKDYDAKNMMHTIRLLQVAEELLRTGKLNVKRNNRKELLYIKSGGMEYDALLKMADLLMLQIEESCSASPLPDEPQKAAAESALVFIRTQLYHI